MTRPPDRLHFQTFGFVVLRGAFDPEPLAHEIDAVLAGSTEASSAPIASTAIRFQYAPMMAAETSASLTMLDRLEAVASDLLGGPVLPTRAKGVRYSGDTPWHTDSDEAVASVGFAAYFEPLCASNGALRVIPGSHRRDFGDTVRAAGGTGLAAAELPAHIVETEPGDVIAFDEHLFHASAGGTVRRQWRVDYVREPEDAEGIARTRAYYARMYPPAWGGGYDVDRYPSYGADWLASGRRSVTLLEALGVYDLASAHEANARPRR